MALMTELKRRNVFRVGAAYAIVAWLLVEVASVVLPTFKAPEWVMQVFTFLLILGFPVALVIAWAFELTPDGIKRESEVEPEEPGARDTDRKLDFIIIGILIVAVAYFAAEKCVTDDPREKSIAVLRFVNNSLVPENAFFTIGMRDAIRTRLSKFRELKVAGGVDRLPPDLPISEIRTKLGVATVLDGSVQRDGDRVRINVQLIDCEDEASLWAEEYDRKLTAIDLFQIQKEIAEIVAKELRIILSKEEKDQLLTFPTESLAAYDAYLHGMQLLREGSSESMKRAADYFQQAIDLDPGFALAYVGLADAHLYLVGWFGLPRDEMFSKAEVLIETALELDDQLGEAYYVLADLQNSRMEYEDAEANYQRALKLNPNSAMTYFNYGVMLRTAGRPEEALTQHKKGVELERNSPGMIQQVGLDLDAMGRFDEGMSWYEKSFDVSSDYPFNLWIIGAHHWWISGDYGKAISWFRRAISSDPGDPFNASFLGRLFMDLGDLDQAEHWVDRSIELGPESFVANQAMYLLHFYRGDQTAGLEYGQTALANVLIGSVAQLHPVQLIGNYELRAGRTSAARALYEKSHPELLVEDAPRVNNNNYLAAIDLAMVLSKAGEQDRADLLLELASRLIETLPRLSWAGYWIADVKIFALRGEKQKALSALRQAIDEGWRSLWWYFLKHDPNLESLHDEPEYQAMVAEIEADMAAQLARVREMERNGELEPIPELPATTD